jgi:hypothetical protein
VAPGPPVGEDGRVLYAFGFERVGVVLGDLYFVDPAPAAGQEGAERGVRLEVRLLERPTPPGSVYASQPIEIARPIWRADLLEGVDGSPGSFDRTHHHPRMRGWEPLSRTVDDAMSADPVGWVGERLADLDGLLAGAEIDPAEVDPGDAAALRDTVPEILDALRRLLARVHAGELAAGPDGSPTGPARAGWL